MKRAFFLCLCLSVLPGGAPGGGREQRGLKITVRNVSPGGQSSESTEYVQQDRKRYEYKNEGSPRMAVITRCDLGRSYELNLDDHRYHWSPLPVYPTREELQAAAKRAAAKRPQKAVAPASPTVLVETTTVDTGERRMMFGHEARHVVTTRRQIPLGRSGAEPHGSEDESKTVTDGWYIDLDEMPLACDPWWQSSKYSHHAYVTFEDVTTHSYLSSPSAPRVVPVFKDVGKPESGRPVQTVTTSRSTLTLPDGTTSEHVWTFETRVAELTEGPLDPALFEVPPGFHHDWLVSLQAEMNWAWQRVTAAAARLFD